MLPHAVLASFLAATFPALAPAEYLERSFGLLAVDGGLLGFQLTPEGWVRSAAATLAIELDGVSLDPWTWDAGGPGLARSSARGSLRQLAVSAAAIHLEGLEHQDVLVPSPDGPDSIPFQGANPVALVRLRIHGAEGGDAGGGDGHGDDAEDGDAKGGGGTSRLVVRVSSDTGLTQAVVLSGGIVSHRTGPPRPAALWSREGNTGVAVADSLVLYVGSEPDSAVQAIGPDGERAADLLELVYRPAGAFELELRMPCFALPLEGDGTGGGESGGAKPGGCGSGGGKSGACNVVKLAAGDGKALITRAGEAWRARLDRGVRIRLPEAPVELAVRASLYHLLGGSWVEASGRRVVLGAPFSYRHFYMRDAALAVIALDRYGFHAEARAGLEFMLGHQLEDGELASHRDQHDGTGQALWALGEHLALTRDPEFAAVVMPCVSRAMNWFRAALMPHRGASPGGRASWDTGFPGLLPATTMPDAEQVLDGHIVGHNLWADAGMRGAIEIARVAGEGDSLLAWRRLQGRFRATLERNLEELLEQTGGVLMPAFEGATARSRSPGAYGRHGGLDWGNLEIVFPTGVWRGGDPRLRTSIEKWCAQLKEGLYPYPHLGEQGLIHHYLTTSLAHTLLESGTDSDRRQLFTIFYEGLLGHATRMYGGAEMIDRFTRDVYPSDNIPPHNTFSSRYLALARDLLVSEFGDSLVVGQGLAPAWLEADGAMGLDDTPTRFGWVRLAIDVRAGKDGAANLDVRLGIAETAPARLLSPLEGFSPPRTPVRTAPPRRRLQAIVIPAPLGYRITAVRDSGGASAGSVQLDGRRAVMAANRRTFTVELRADR